MHLWSHALVQFQRSSGPKEGVSEEMRLSRSEGESGWLLLY